MYVPLKLEMPKFNANLSVNKIFNNPSTLRNEII